MSENKANSSIDLAKFIASILIFSMHANALGDFLRASVVLELLARWGVPFFFICSSYFLFRKNINGVIEKKVMINYSARICSLYFLWFIYNLPSVFFTRLYSKDLYRIATWLNFIKNSLLSSTFTGSWFIVSCIFSAWVLYILSKKLRTEVIIAITFIPFLLCAFTSVYDGILPDSMHNILIFLHFPLNIFNGCFYFALGKMLADNSKSITKEISSKLIILLIIAFYGIYIMEVMICTRMGILSSTDVGFSLPIIAYLLMILCLRTNFTIKKNVLLRKLSTIIFFSQGNVLLIRPFCIHFLHIHSSIIIYLFMIMIMLIICLSVLFLQRHTHWKWIKYMT